jgi:hypothetical protein
MMRQADEDPSYVFACVQSLEKANPQLRQDIIDWLNKRVGTLECLLKGSD